MFLHWIQLIHCYLVARRHMSHVPSGNIHSFWERSKRVCYRTKKVSTFPFMKERKWIFLKNILSFWTPTHVYPESTAFQTTECRTLRSVQISAGYSPVIITSNTVSCLTFKLKQYRCECSTFHVQFEDTKLGPFWKLKISKINALLIYVFVHFFFYKKKVQL